MEDKKNISVYIVEDYLLTRVTYKKALKDYENINIIGDFETAEEYVKSEKYFWNSGIFMFKASTFMNELKKYYP